MRLSASRHRWSLTHMCVMKVIARLQDWVLCASITGIACRAGTRMWERSTRISLGHLGLYVDDGR